MDSSVLLRIVLGQRGRLEEWNSIETGVASALVEVECLRTLDRFRLSEALSEEAVAVRREAIDGLVQAMEIVEIDRAILSRASAPLSTPLRTLDAIHLASALLWREQSDLPLVMATHDPALATAARAHGLKALGV